MGRSILTALWLAPLLWAFILLMMSVDNPFSLAFSAILMTSQAPLVRWILARGAARPILLSIRR